LLPDLAVFVVNALIASLHLLFCIVVLSMQLGMYSPVQNACLKLHVSRSGLGVGSLMS
jgi:hypothetical protein